MRGVFGRLVTRSSPAASSFPPPTPSPFVVLPLPPSPRHALFRLFSAIAHRSNTEGAIERIGAVERSVQYFSSVDRTSHFLGSPTASSSYNHSARLRRPARHVDSPSPQCSRIRFTPPIRSLPFSDAFRRTIRSCSITLFYPIALRDFPIRSFDLRFCRLRCSGRLFPAPSCIIAPFPRFELDESKTEPAGSSRRPWWIRSFYSQRIGCGFLLPCALSLPFSSRFAFISLFPFPIFRNLLRFLPSHLAPVRSCARRVCHDA